MGHCGCVCFYLGHAADRAAMPPAEVRVFDQHIRQPARRRVHRDVVVAADLECDRLPHSPHEDLVLA